VDILCEAAKRDIKSEGRGELHVEYQPCINTGCFV
jgi:hypothetical protein